MKLSKHLISAALLQNLNRIEDSYAVYDLFVTTLGKKIIAAKER